MLFRILDNYLIDLDFLKNLKNDFFPQSPPAPPQLFQNASSLTNKLT